MSEIKKKHAGGRPRLWNTPEALQHDIDDYFDSITRMRPKMENVAVGKDDKGNDVFERQPILDVQGREVLELEWVITPTIYGLAHHIGCDRQTVMEYKLYDEFSPLIKNARERIAAYHEKRLDERPQAAGTIFWLKQGPDGWKDAQTLDISRSQALPSYDVSRMTIEQKRALYDLLMLASQDPDADIDLPQIAE